jgi:hypothetical protein
MALLNNPAQRKCGHSAANARRTSSVRRNGAAESSETVSEPAGIRRFLQRRVERNPARIAESGRANGQ